MYVPRSRLFWSVGLGHFTNDVFMSMGVVLLTFMSVSLLPMSNAQIGFAVSCTQLLGALSQPFFGLRADRDGGRWLGAGGLAWVATMALGALLMAVVTRNYWLMFVPFVLTGLGSGAVHPVGALQAAASAEKQRVASNMAFFFLMGQLGLALGPTLVGVLLDLANTHWLTPYQVGVGMNALPPVLPNVTPVFFLGFMALPAVLMMATTIPRRRSAQKAQDKGFDWASLPYKALVILAVMVLTRGIASPGSINFLPALFQSKGWTPAHYGMITSAFWLTSAFSGVLLGYMADRFGRRAVVGWSMLACAPAFFLLPSVDGALAFVLVMLAGALSGSPTLLVVIAQDLIPAGKGFASGAMLGFIFGTGALGSLFIGTLADNIGLSASFQWVAVLAAVSAVLTMFLPNKRA